MSFLLTLHPYPADPESLVQLIISFNKVLVPIQYIAPTILSLEISYYV